MATQHFHKVVYQLTKLIMAPIFFCQGFRWKHYKPHSKQYMVLTNHTTNSDSFYGGMCFARHMYFVAGENVLRIPVAGPILKVVVSPIYRKKGASGEEARRAIVERIKKGNRVCMTVEGNKSFDGASTSISPNTAHLVRECGVPVITVRIHGGFMVQPRWSDVKRHGRIWSEVVHEYSLEEIASYTDEELNKHILDDIYVNAYEDQKKYMYTYKGKNLAQGIERILYLCPKCHGISTIKSCGNGATCSKCGLQLEYDDKGFFHSKDTEFTTIFDWNNWQRDELLKYLATVKDNEKAFDTQACYKLYRLNGAEPKKELEHGTFDVYKDKIVIGEHTFLFKDILHFSLSMSSKALFSTTDGGYWQVKSESFDSMVKFLIAVQYFQGKPIHLR